MSDTVRAVPKPSQEKIAAKNIKTDKIESEKRRERARNAANAMWAKRRAIKQNHEPQV